MANPLKAVPLGWQHTPLVDKNGMASAAFIKWLTKAIAPATQVVNTDGEIHPEAPVSGRTEGLGTTVQNLTATGQVSSTDAIIDGTGSPLTGGKRGFQALDSNNQIATSFNLKPVVATSTPLSAVSLRNNGIDTIIQVSSEIFQFGAGTVHYDSGSCDPGGYGSFYVFADDPQFKGGAVNFQFSINAADRIASDGRLPFGKITTTGGTPQTGGGNTGGTTPDGAGGVGLLSA